MYISLAESNISKYYYMLKCIVILPFHYRTVNYNIRTIRTNKMHYLVSICFNN